MKLYIVDDNTTVELTSYQLATTPHYHEYAARGQVYYDLSDELVTTDDLIGFIEEAQYN